MIVIYCIRNIVSGKRYVGKTVNSKSRWYGHKYAMKNPIRSKDCNLHLWNSAQKHGIHNFVFEILESFDACDEDLMKERELYWMDYYKSTDRNFGYNLRRDSSSRMIVHSETRKRLSSAMKGNKNPNYNNPWSEDQRNKMSEIAISRHASGNYYSDTWKKKIGIAATEKWKDSDLKSRMARNVSLAKRKYDFEQYTREGSLVKVWSSVEDIISENPTYKWQNIYSVCNGYKKTYHGYVWKKILKEINAI